MIGGIGTYYYSPDLQRQLLRRERRAAMRRMAWWALVFATSGVIWAGFFWALGLIH